MQEFVPSVSRAALQEMVKPGLLPVLSPIIVGVCFRILGGFRSRPDLGAEVVASFLMFSTATGEALQLESICASC